MTRGESKLQTFVAGRYQVKRPLGEGSRKRVYLAHDTRLDRPVALALIKTDGLDAAGLARVRQEAQAMGRLGDHPHIVTVYDVGEENGQPYVVSQFMAGGSVADLLEASRGERSEGSTDEVGSASPTQTRDPSASRPLRLDETLHIGDHICRALEHAHAHDVIHRDLKPANVWLTADGTAKLGDFGLALARERSRMTVEGLMVGTVAYMAPEQALGNAVGPRTDLYALGAMLYEMATGRPPFAGDDAVAVISQHLHTAPVAPVWHNVALPAELEALILQLLEKEPARRPPHATAVREALQRVATGPSATASGTQVSAPALPASTPAANPLDRLEAGIFVGREDEMTTLRSAVEDACAGRGRALLIAGEPGIGKTRTAQEIATYARLRGVQVLWGRGYEGGGAPAYWPWVQIIRSHVHERSAEELLADMGPGAANIASVMSVVRERFPDLPPPPRLEPEQERFRLFDSVTTFLKNTTRRRTLMLILDDMHWADPASLLLLQFLAREIAATRLITIVSYRDEEALPGQPLFQALAELARETRTEWILLHGLSPPEVAAYIERAAGQRPAEQLVNAIMQHTAGNPFFVGEVVRWLVAEKRLDKAAAGSVGVPPSVREVIGRRLERLSARCNQMLTVAAVAGRIFSPNLIASATDLTETQVLEALEEASAARVVSAASEPVGHYTFVHALIRETVYAALSVNRRIALHRRIGQILEALHGVEPDPASPTGSRLLLLRTASGIARVQPPKQSILTRPAPLWAELAYHFGEAATLGEIDKAIAYAQRAAERAIEQLAYEDAVVHCQRALRILAGTHGNDPRRRYDVVVTLAAAQSCSPQPTAARATLLEAIEIARQTGEKELLAAAVLGLPVPDGVFDREVGDLLEEGLRALGPADSPLRSLLLGRLAKHSRLSPERERHHAVSEEAVAIARRIGDPTTLAHALINHWHAIAGPDALDEQLAVAVEVLRLADETDDKALRFYALEYRSTVSLLRGDVSRAYDDLDAHEQLLREIWGGRDVKVGYARSMRALLEGRFAVAERLAHEALGSAQRIGSLNAALIYGAQLYFLHNDRGDLGGLVAAVRRSIAEYPAIAAWRGG
jgi:hypothetical protein